MTDGKVPLLCMKASLMKWMVHTRVWSAFLIMAVFVFYTLDGLPELARAYDSKITAWVLPLVLSRPVMVATYGCMTILLFCNAPYIDNHTPFLIARAGRKNYIIGQLLYTVVVAWLFTVFMLIISMLCMLPDITFSSDWGVIGGMASGSVQGRAHGINLSTGIPPALVITYTPIQATLYSFLLMWLTAAFMGILILFFNCVAGKLSGIVAGGVVTFWAYFAEYAGPLSFGRNMKFYSPLSWSSILTINYSSTEGNPAPSLAYALCVLAGLCIAMGIVSVVAFCKRDLDYPHWRD